jgi:hypothetical protein
VRSVSESRAERRAVYLIVDCSYTESPAVVIGFLCPADGAALTGSNGSTRDERRIAFVTMPARFLRFVFVGAFGMCTRRRHQEACHEHTRQEREYCDQ